MGGVEMVCGCRELGVMMVMGGSDGWYIGTLRLKQE